MLATSPSAKNHQRTFVRITTTAGVIKIHWYEICRLVEKKLKEYVNYN